MRIKIRYWVGLVLYILLIGGIYPTLESRPLICNVSLLMFLFIIMTIVVDSMKILEDIWHYVKSDEGVRGKR